MTTTIHPPLALSVDGFVGSAGLCLLAGDDEALIQVLRIMSVYHPIEAFEFRWQIIDAALSALEALGGAA